MARGLLAISIVEARSSYLHETHAMLAAPKIPNLRAPSLLAGLGGAKALQIRLTNAAIWIHYRIIIILLFQYY